MTMQNRHRIVYMGTPDFAVEPLRALHGAGHEVLAVFTQPDRPSGRGKQMRQPEVKAEALRLGLSVHQPETLRDGQAFGLLSRLQPDVVVVAAYAQLLPADVLGLPRYGCKNIHASLLPRFRGGAPIQWAIAKGEQETGISIMQMDAGLDTGDIILKQALAIGPEESSGDLTKRLSRLGAEMIVSCLALPDLGESLRTPQEHNKATFARNLRKSDGLIAWSRTAQQIHDSIRAFSPWPGAYTFLGSLRVTIHRSRVLAHNALLAPGEIAYDQGRLLAGTGAGSLHILELTPAGKKSMDGAAFATGYLGRLAQQEQRFSHQ